MNLPSEQPVHRNVNGKLVHPLAPDTHVGIQYCDDPCMREGFEEFKTLGQVSTAKSVEIGASGQGPSTTGIITGSRRKTHC